MANRSYLFACDDAPTVDGVRAGGLSECKYDIPLVHKLMMARSPRVVRSAIFPEHRAAIIADRDGAAERTIAFFELIGHGPLDRAADYAAELEEMKQFLAEQPPSKLLLLEAGEIFTLLGNDLAEQAEALVLEIDEVAARAERALAGGEREWLAELRATWRDQASPGYWNDALYYDLASDPAPSSV